MTSRDAESDPMPEVEHPNSDNREAENNNTNNKAKEKEEEEKKPQQQQPAVMTPSRVSVGVGTDDHTHEGHKRTTDENDGSQASSSKGSSSSSGGGSGSNREGGSSTGGGGGSKTTKAQRTCRVCGDNAKSMHFGGLSCDSCKAFFRRAVHNDAHLNFSCPYDGTCVMNITSRKCCQHCRYKKCRSIGMETAWVMSEEERANLMKQKAGKKARAEEEEGGGGGGGGAKRGSLKDTKRELVPFEPDLTTMLDYMTAKERDEVEQAVLNYRRAYTDVPYRHDLRKCNQGRPSIQIINMFTTIVRRFAYFARLFPHFRNLPDQDQGNLLRGGILEMSLIRGVQSFDTTNNRWPNTSQQLYKDAPTLNVEDMKKLVSFDLYEMHMKFIYSLKDLNVDEPVMMLLLLIVLFTSDRPGLLAPARVQTSQDQYLHLLRKYINWRYGPHNASILYPRLLMKLTDLRELNDQHNEYNLKLAKQEVAEIQQQLGQLNLNPYTEWPTILQQQNDEPGRTIRPAESHKQEQHDTSSLKPSGITSLSGAPVHGGQSPGTIPVLQSENRHIRKEPAEGEPSETPLGTGMSSGGLPNPASMLDFEQLAKNPRFQQMIMQQFQKSIINILSLPNFGLGTSFPNDMDQQHSSTASALQHSQVSESHQPSNSNQRTSQHKQLPHLKDQLQSMGSSGSSSSQYQSPSTSYPSSDLMTQIDYMECSQSNNSNMNQQTQQAFQQVENQLMSNIGEFSHCGNQNQFQQDYQQPIQQDVIQQQQQQALVQQQINQQQIQEEMQQQQMYQQDMNTEMIIPKQEPVTQSIPAMHYPSVASDHSHPLLDSPQHQENLDQHHRLPFQTSPTMSHRQTNQSDQENGQPSGSSLTDASGLTQFRNLLEEFALLDNPVHLEQVKQILGSDLVSSLKQKLIASGNEPFVHQQPILQHQFQHSSPPLTPSHIQAISSLTQSCIPDTTHSYPMSEEQFSQQLPNPMGNVNVHYHSSSVPCSNSSSHEYHGGSPPANGSPGYHNENVSGNNNFQYHSGSPPDSTNLVYHNESSPGSANLGYHHGSPPDSANIGFHINRHPDSSNLQNHNSGPINSGNPWYSSGSPHSSSNNRGYHSGNTSDKGYLEYNSVSFPNSAQSQQYMMPARPVICREQQLTTSSAMAPPPMSPTVTQTVTTASTATMAFQFPSGSAHNITSPN